ncbi:MAG: 3-deoxy-manno-octulosonate cytidylyltransferase [Helicobacteraceae bacterium]|nr:3-deoxy-manno-octulosonate cytidylyltransferase [Helicobacteraceae bacterium]
MRVAIVIPARYASTRFAGKLLAQIGSKPVIARTYEQSCKAKNADRVVVATDDERIASLVRGIGGEVVMTSPNCENGTARILEASATIDADVYVNVQGDEPFIDPSSIDAAIEALKRYPQASIATLYHAIKSDEARNPNAVKLVMDASNRVIYFSRAPIPFDRDGAGAEYLKHIGLYAYRKEALMAYANLPRSPLEEAEKLEQLRYLQAGWAIYAAKTNAPLIAIDTPDDLRRAEAFLRGEEDGNALANIKLLLSDVDGVLSPSAIVFDAAGESAKAFSVRDGLGIEVAMKLGITVGVITGRDSRALRKRLEILKIGVAYFGVKDKGAICREVMSKLGIRRDQTLFVGDDAPDLAAFEACGVSCAVADAPEYIKSKATITLKSRGGDGAIREVIDMILSAQGKIEFLSDAKCYARLQGN